MVPDTHARSSSERKVAELRSNHLFGPTMRIEFLGIRKPAGISLNLTSADPDAGASTNQQSIHDRIPQGVSTQTPHGRIEPKRLLDDHPDQPQCRVVCGIQPAVAG